MFPVTDISFLAVWIFIFSLIKSLYQKRCFQTNQTNYLAALGFFLKIGIHSMQATTRHQLQEKEAHKD